MIALMESITLLGIFPVTWTHIEQYLGLPVFAVLCALFLHTMLFLILPHVGIKIKSQIDKSLFRHLSEPMRWILIAIAIRLVVPYLELSQTTIDIVKQSISVCLTMLVSWLLIKVTHVFDDFVAMNFDIKAKDNLRARKVYTQLHVLKRLVVVLVGFFALGTILMSFEKVRQLGTSLLASAGIAGIVLGIAAQKTIGNFIAGLQIAFTQPMRIDDVVIVENEWGRIEEITLTYVVILLWDMRRLVVPLTYFIERPFQNWTRVSADILGTVFLYVDYSLPVDALRQELHRILEASPLWDKKIWALQVTGTSERAIELRALMSVADASAAWNLRCEVREKLISFIQQNYPQALPRLRTEIPADGSDVEQNKSVLVTK